VDFGILALVALAGLAGYQIYTKRAAPTFNPNDPSTFAGTDTVDDSSGFAVTHQGDNAKGETLLNLFSGIPLVSGLDTSDPNAGYSTTVDIGPAVDFQWKQKYDPLIWQLCDSQYRVAKPAVIKAFVSVESSFIPSALRMEPGINDMSVGLMQLLTETARMLAKPIFNGLTHEQIRDRLFDPQTNLSLGIKYVVYQMGRYRAVLGDVAAAYNAGSVKLNSKGEYVNAAYVNKILAAVEKYKDDFPPLSTS
jgi:hypothetical protein